MVDWVLLLSGESNKGLDFGSLYCSLSADALCLQAGKACSITGLQNDPALIQSSQGAGFRLSSTLLHMSMAMTTFS